MSERRAASASLLPTLAGSTLVLALALWLLWRATDGLSAWTFEEQRFAAASQGRLATSPIMLTDAEGKALTVFDAGAAPGRQDEVFLVDFIYTGCPSACQVLGSEYLRMQDRLGRSASTHRIRLLSISLDPARDGPAELAAYGKLHRTDPAYWTLASPQDAAAGRALMRDLGVIAIPDGFGGFVHNAGIHLIDARGRLRAVFPYDQWEAALTAAGREAPEGAP